jgi:hypothetical protein
MLAFAITALSITTIVLLKPVPITRTTCSASYSPIIASTPFRYPRTWNFKSSALYSLRATASKLALK